MLKAEYSLEGAGVLAQGPVCRPSPDAAPSPWGAHFTPMSPLGPRVGLAEQRGPWAGREPGCGQGSWAGGSGCIQATGTAWGPVNL